jgi:hypothetical protein
MTEPSQLVFIEKFLNWQKVEERLNRYEYIADLFSLDDLKRCTAVSPYYCHYMSWRLGTWKNEDWFEYFNKLLEKSKKIRGWEMVSRVPGGCEFDKFWGFVWELQSAIFFSEGLGLIAEWEKEGPDIKVSVNDTNFYVECTTYRKSFALEEFIGELFHLISPTIRSNHIPCTSFSLPKNQEINDFLDNLFKPYLDPAFLKGEFKRLESQTPLLLPIPTGIDNFYIYLENEKAKNHDYAVERILTSAGDPVDFLSIACKEAVKNKTLANNLQNIHPNLLMVNFVLGSDWQLARSLRKIPEPTLSEVFDGIFFAACGIDEIPAIRNSFICLKPDHPLDCIMKQLTA